jgi:hypothetical protein
MKNAIRTALSATALCAALALPAASKASGQVFFQGNFPLPHGRISVGVGGPAFDVGAYVPSPYIDQIEYVPGYGYGFYCDDGWVPVRRYSRGWVVYQRPFFIERERLYGHRGFDRFNRFDRQDRFDRRSDRFDRRSDRFDRRYDRSDRDRDGRGFRDRRY